MSNLIPYKTHFKNDTIFINYKKEMIILTPNM